MIEQVLTAVELTIKDLEEKSLTDPEKETLSHLDRLSRQLIVFRRHFWRVIDVVNFLTHIEEDKNEIKYIQMAYDNITQLIELVESYRDTINSVRKSLHSKYIFANERYYENPYNICINSVTTYISSKHLWNEWIGSE